MIKLRSSVILKPVNTNCVYALDCEDTGEFFFKFEGVSKIFIELINNAIEENELLLNVQAMFPDVEAKQIETDFKDFVSTIKELNLLSA